jgi:hypothetical protein
VLRHNVVSNRGPRWPRGENSPSPAPSPQQAVDPGARTALGLPAQVRTCLFDLDGVLTDTAKLHAAAWKEMFDGFLTARAEQTGSAFVAFDEVSDYDAYVDGKSRSDGTRSFLQSRGIELSTGASNDDVGEPTVSGLERRDVQVTFRGEPN